MLLFAWKCPAGRGISLKIFCGKGLARRQDFRYNNVRHCEVTRRIGSLSGNAKTFLDTKEGV